MNRKDSIAKRLKELRKVLGFSQRDLAKEFRVSPGAVAHWESGKREVPGPVIKLIEIYEENLGMFHDKSLTISKINSDWASRTLKKSTTVAKLATLGQMAGYIDFGLPDKTREMLEVLFNNTPPMDEAAVNDVFRQEFNRLPEDIFSSWDPKPFAAASIGQVHRARLHDGTEVAVKVQYPAVVESIHSDMRHAGKLEGLFRTMFRYQDKGIFNELKQHLLAECDYLNEAANIEHFQKLFAGDHEFIIPKVYRSYSTKKILVTEFVEAQSFREFRESATQDERDRAGSIIFRFSAESIFKHGVFNTDPNPGNFLFRDGTVVFLDFGSVKTFSEETTKGWRAVYRSLKDSNPSAFRKAVVSGGFVPLPEKVDFDRLREHFKITMGPYLYEGKMQWGQLHHGVAIYLGLALPSSSPARSASGICRAF